LRFAATEEEAIVRNATPVNNQLGASGEFPRKCYIFGSAHPGGFNAGFAAGSTRSISYDVDATAFKRAANRQDGEANAESL
jgi:hypothetical protein